MLAEGCSADSLDDSVEMGESTILKSLRKFVAAVVKRFESAYLRMPTSEEVVSNMSVNARRGFPGMFGSIDCMHWFWKVHFSSCMLS